MQKNKFPRRFKPKKAGFALLVFLVLYLGAAAVPYTAHKKVSDSFKSQIRAENYYGERVGSERVSYIDDNTDALLYRLKLIEEAKNEIIFSTFDFNVDQAGQDILAALYQASLRGVHIRMIIDGISGFLDVRGEPLFQVLASQETVEIKIYNPVNFLKPWKFQARLHDKYLIADDRMYLLGGRNTMNLFLGDYSSSKNIDRDLFVYETEPSRPASLQQLSDYFEQVWNLPDSREYPFKKETRKVSKAREHLKKRYEELKSLYETVWQPWDWESLTVETQKISLLSNPVQAENKEPHLWYALNQILRSGEKISVYTPYIICGREMYDDLTQTCRETSHLEIITNDVSSGANPWGCTDYLNQKKNIWETGTQVYEFMGTHSSHTKAALVDERLSIVGSYNWDMRSTYQDTELMLVVDSADLNSVIRKEMERDKTYSRTMTSEGTYQYGENYQEKELSTGKKIFYSILRVLILPIRRFL